MKARLVFLIMIFVIGTAALMSIAGVPNLPGPASIDEVYVSQILPSQVQDGNVAAARGSRYGEFMTMPVVRKEHTLANEGTYFVANNAQTGILEGTNKSWVTTTPTIVITNTGVQGTAGAANINLSYIDLTASAAGVTATAVSAKWFAVYLDNGSRYTSGGTALTPARPNLNYAVGGSVAQVWFGAITAPAATASVRAIVGQRLYRLPVTTTTAPDVIGDRFRLEFGSVESEVPLQIGTTGALMANAYQSVAKAPPLVIGPGQSAIIYTWTACTTYSTGTTWLPELGWWER